MSDEGAPEPSSGRRISLKYKELTQNRREATGRDEIEPNDYGVIHTDLVCWVLENCPENLDLCASFLECVEKRIRWCCMLRRDAAAPAAPAVHVKDFRVGSGSQVIVTGSSNDPVLVKHSAIGEGALNLGKEARLEAGDGAQIGKNTKHNSDVRQGESKVLVFGGTVEEYEVAVRSQLADDKLIRKLIAGRRKIDSALTGDDLATSRAAYGAMTDAAAQAIAAKVSSEQREYLVGRARQGWNDLVGVARDLSAVLAAAKALASAGVDILGR